jgi:hypothetical protein
MEVAQMIKKVFWCIVFFSFIMTVYAKEQVFQSSPPMQKVSTSHYEVELEPLKAEGYQYYNRFRYQFTNKTDGNLVISWSKSYFILNGKRNGNFGWEGLTFDQLKGIKEEPDVTIPPGGKDAIQIFPLNLMGWREEGVRMKANTPEAGFTLGVIPEGEVGLSIGVMKDGKMLRKSILVNITKNK